MSDWTPVVVYREDLRALQSARRALGFLIDIGEKLGDGLGTELTISLDALDGLIERAQRELEPKRSNVLDFFRNDDNWSRKVR